MFSKIDLEALAERHGPERAFLSLYLRSPEGRTALDNRAARIRQLLEGEENEREYFEQNLERVERFLEDYDWREQSLCIFTCWATDFFKAYPLEKPPTADLLWVGATPYLRPLAELHDEFEDFAVVVADNSEAHVYLVSSSVPVEENRIKGDIKNHVKKGGWSQRRYQRRRENELMHYAKEIVETLEKLDQENDFDRLIMVGSQEALVAIEEELPQRLQDKLAETEPVDVDDEAALWETVFELFEDEEREAERSLWQRIKAEYMRGGTAATGAEDVLQAAAVGRVEHIIVTRDAELAGTHCRACDNVFAGKRDKCGYCESDDVFTTDLVNELVRLAETTGAEVEFSDAIPGLSKAGDVAALLRY